MIISVINCNLISVIFPANKYPSLPEKDIQIESYLVLKLGCVRGQPRGQIPGLHAIKEANLLVQQ